MLAPGSGGKNKVNPNPPKITFRMVRGRIIPIVGGKKVRGATKPLRQELSTRETEVRQADRGMRGVGYNDKREAVRNFGTKSTFPKFFGELGFKSKADFVKTIKSRKGVRYERLVNDSIDSLLHGRSSSFGRIPPDEKFRLATKQEYNNEGVVFRKINGRVVPMRPKHKQKKKAKYDDDVPF